MSTCGRLAVLFFIFLGFPRFLLYMSVDDGIRLGFLSAVVGGVCDVGSLNFTAIPGW